MQIVSYRGPSQPGGVSALIKGAIEGDSYSHWWYLQNESLYSDIKSLTVPRSAITKRVIDGHYRYCNEFLWPLMHGLDQHVSYSGTDHACYRQLNLAVAAALKRECLQGALIHDYQFALLPEYLPERNSSKSVLFWHIPWPATCPPDFVEQLIEIAKGLLYCGKIGFHIQDYVKNFCTFVSEFLPEFRVSPDYSTVRNIEGRATALVAQPAGIDSDYWYNAARSAMPRSLICPYVLSVDRADYTKGILERIDAVGEIFRARPELIGQIQFVFLCQRTRKGLASFDCYWASCRQRLQVITDEFAYDGWSPIVWLADPIESDGLAGWYAGASAMLVNPRIDGLNLTAKEFVAGAMKPDSVLILSNGAGVSKELGKHAVTIESCNADSISQAILQALSEPAVRKQEHLLALKKIVRANTLKRWWQALSLQDRVCTGAIQYDRESA